MARKCTSCQLLIGLIANYGALLPYLLAVLFLGKMSGSKSSRWDLWQPGATYGSHVTAKQPIVGRVRLFWSNPFKYSSTDVRSSISDASSSRFGEIEFSPEGRTWQQPAPGGSVDAVWRMHNGCRLRLLPFLELVLQ